MRVLFLTNYPSPYRVEFFNMLGKETELTVLFTETAVQQRHRNAAWFNENYSSFRAVFLSPKRVGPVSICFDAFAHLKDDYDVIILGGYASPTQMLAIEYMRLHKRPFCLEIDGGLIHADKKTKYLLKRHFIGAASWWLSSGTAANKYLIHYGADRERIFWYPFTSLKKSDIQQECLTNEDKILLRQKLGMTENRILLAVGRFIHLKGFDLLLESSKQLGPETGVYIVGGEPTPEYLRFQTENQLDHIHFVGFVPPTELMDYYRAADLFVLPTRSDVWGLVINEAMACGLPVITTDQCVAGLELIEDGENGYIIPSENSDELKRAILLALDQDLLAMGQRARAKIERYTIEEMVSAHMTFFSEVLENTQ